MNAEQTTEHYNNTHTSSNPGHREDVQTSQVTLSAHNLRKKYKSRTVVTDVSFEVTAGEVVGLLGPNGAGKTTCFYMVVGLVA
ncbi:MAG TPA: ATP-binding cassette domain-containing protein, partial [Rugosibacter sp.]|nr:ATP-binding cassette domain-containing protein [Rugosibacter sp.]